MLAVLQCDGGAMPCRSGGSVGAAAVSGGLDADRGRRHDGAGRLWEPLTKNLLYAAIATLVVAPLALGRGGRYARVLGSRPMVWLGEISYEIFLLHVVVMALVLGVVLHWPLFTGSMPVLFVLTLAITVPLAMLLRRITEPRRNIIWNSPPGTTPVGVYPDRWSPVPDGVRAGTSPGPSPRSR